jgi:selenocysteine lyase/cysteine desulfurase
VILCGNTTQALDLAAHVMAHREGVTLVSLMEHHSNDLPHRSRGKVVHFGVKDDGTLDYDDLEAKLRQHPVKLVAVTGASNVTGYLPDIHQIARLAHAHGARILIDGAQILAHAPVDVLPDSDPGHLDFFAGAGHKAYAPFGSSFLFGPVELFDAAPPYIPAGGTVVYVTEDEAYYKKSPDRHEGGTPNIAGAVALAAALRFLEEAGMEEVRAHERALVAQAMDGLGKLDGVRLLGHPAPEKRIGALALTIDGIPHELAASILNREAAIAVRNGCFCAHPYLHRLREVDELVRMIRLIRDRGWKGDYVDIPRAAACREL